MNTCVDPISCGCARALNVATTWTWMLANVSTEATLVPPFNSISQEHWREYRTTGNGSLSSLVRRVTWLMTRYNPAADGTIPYRRLDDETVQCIDLGDGNQDLTSEHMMLNSLGFTTIRSMYRNPRQAMRQISAVSTSWRIVRSQRKQE